MLQNSMLYELELRRAMGWRYINKNAIFEANSSIFKDLDSLNLQIKNCNLCTLCKTRQNAVTGSGNAKSNVVFVFSSPTQKSDEVGSCVAQNIKECLSAIDIEPENIYFTYIIKCLMKLESGRFFEICGEYFEQELRVLRPKILVSFGKSAFSWLTKSRGDEFESCRGGIFKLKNSLYLPTFDDEWVAKNPSFKAQFLEDLKKIKGYL